MPQAAVERAIAAMWDHYDERLSLDDIADMANLSKFYFSRAFRSITGISPGRFLTAIRLYRAKHLLLETSLSVTDIAYHVGFSSLGTFTTRFTRSVGVPPSRFRALSRCGIPPIPTSTAAGTEQSCSLRGKIVQQPVETPVRIYACAFDSPIVEGLPAACDVLDSTAAYQMNGVPAGEWHVRAVAVAVRDVDPRPWARRPLSIGTCPLITLSADREVEMDIDMRPARITDLPILLALPELDSHELPEPMGATA